jgi:STE24 endopeptidase
MFERDQIERARRYHRPLYLLLVVVQALELALFLFLAFGPGGGWLESAFSGVSWWLAAIAFPGAALIASSLLLTPLALWSRRHEQEWGFSTESLGGWIFDRIKGLSLTLVFGAVPLAGLVYAARVWPGGWRFLAAAGAALLVLLASFLSPLLIEPVFNRFQPLADEALASDLRALAERAGSPVREVLVADASRRTRKVNAYVSGIGGTRRLVLYDTLLEQAPPEEIRLVVAHELGHRRERHVLYTTLLEVGGAVVAVLFYSSLLDSSAVRKAAGIVAPGDPRATLFALALFSVLGAVGAPLFSSFSRAVERAADLASLELTADPGLFERTHKRLALANLVDLDPPSFFYLWRFTHPTPPERIEMARDWAALHRPPRSARPTGNGFHPRP